MNYEQAKVERDQLSNLCSIYSKELQKFPRGPMGLVTDEAKQTSEYKITKKHSEIAFGNLRAFNEKFTKAFKKEIRAEHKAKYSY